MKLQARFLQLPLSFDAGRLAAEIADLDPALWLPHPTGFAGNDFLPLISANGDPNSEAFRGPMRPTPHLAERSYLADVLASLGATLGRTRLMRLSNHAEVTPHIDVNYYWRERMRVHVPIVTQPTVRFICGDQDVNMKAGECWIFDTWSKHRVINDADQMRTHLVIDTVGGEGFWKLIDGARDPSVAHEGWSAKRIDASGATFSALDFETYNVPTVMSPWEVQSHLWFLLHECAPGQASHPATVQAVARFIRDWLALWSAFGEAEAAWPRYRERLDAFYHWLRDNGAQTLRLRNGGDFFTCAFAEVIDIAIADGPEQIRGETRDAAPALTRT